jgi:hypothetical protein
MKQTKEVRSTAFQAFAPAPSSHLLLLEAEELEKASGAIKLSSPLIRIWCFLIVCDVYTKQGNVMLSRKKRKEKSVGDRTSDGSWEGQLEAFYGR